MGVRRYLVFAVICALGLLAPLGVIRYLLQPMSTDQYDQRIAWVSEDEDVSAARRFLFLVASGTPRERGHP